LQGFAEVESGLAEGAGEAWWTGAGCGAVGVGATEAGVLAGGVETVVEDGVTSGAGEAVGAGALEAGGGWSAGATVETDYAYGLIIVRIW
jgi:hypothetical protein